MSEFFGSSAGLLASVVTRLTTTWQDEQKRFGARSLAEVDYVYVWVDGVHFNVRLDESRLCALVVVGVRADGTMCRPADPGQWFRGIRRARIPSTHIGRAWG